MQPKLVEEILAEAIGLNTDSIGADAVEVAVRRRMETAGLPDREAYLRRLAADGTELEALVEEVTVPETWFFRDRGPFEFVPRWAATEWAPRYPTRSLRVLSLPCASGEEPYSIAMTLLDHGFDRFRIVGVDVRRSAIEAAQRGVFGPSSFRGHDLGYRGTWFRQTEAGWEIDALLRERVSFEVGNALDRKLLAAAPAFDVVLCRNLMIYLRPDARRKVIGNLDRLLSKDGILVAGHAETEMVWRERFVSLHQPRAFAFAKRDERAPAAKQEVFARFPERRSSVKPPDPPPAPPAAKGLDLRLAEARAHADRGRLEEAEVLCRSSLEDEPCAEGYFLLAIVRQAGGEELEAEALFERALYLDPSHYEALVSLALLKERHGDRDAAARFRRRAERALGENVDGKLVRRQAG